MKGSESIGMESLSFAGCTANVCLIADGHIIVANCGDSRTLLCLSGNQKGSKSGKSGSGKLSFKPYPLSVDHKPDDEKEYNRVVKA